MLSIPPLLKYSYFEGTWHEALKGEIRVSLAKRVLRSILIINNTAMFKFFIENHKLLRTFWIIFLLWLILFLSFAVFCASYGFVS
jgi:hypothetical protein